MTDGGQARTQATAAACDNGAADPMRLVSLLDTDLYKLTMQNAILQEYPHARVVYRFTNRSEAESLMTRECIDLIRAMVDGLIHTRLRPEERAYLAEKCPYFPPAYLDYLAAFAFRPSEHARVGFLPREAPPGLPPSDAREWGALELTVSGLWHETVLYEVPLLSIISQAYFATVRPGSWDYSGQVALAAAKMRRLVGGGCRVAEFGTRRRRSFLAQDLVMRGLTAGAAAAAGSGRLVGSSNVYFAIKYGVQPVGTIAHEMVMGVAALEGYEGANGKVLDLWDKVYPSGSLAVALTDTFSTKPFFADFLADPERAKRWKGLRQDSGDPKEFARAAKAAWKQLGVDPATKPITFSDGLDTDSCLDLQQWCDREGLSSLFGVGTHLTNDYRETDAPDKANFTGEGEPRTRGEKSKALNIVIKLTEIDGRPCIKISDDPTKIVGDPETVRMVKRQFGLGGSES